MPDIEKVINGIEACLPSHDPECDLCPYDSIDRRCRAKLRDDVMALLKAQEPIAPIQGADDQDEDIFCCGSCGAVVGETFLGPPGECEVRDNYCPECGRAVKWE